MLRRLSFRTGGESHGAQVTAILEGLPRGLKIDQATLDSELRRRQGGAGRGGRQRIEDDRAQIVGGVRRGETIGSPLVLAVPNRDHKIDELPEPSRPRPGHIDLAAAYRYLDTDIRGSLERASARETAGRVAAGGVAAQFLAALGCRVFGFVRSVGSVELPRDVPGDGRLSAADIDRLTDVRDSSRLYTLDTDVDQAMLGQVQEAAREQDTVGGVVEVRVCGVLPGLGSHLQWSERLDAILAGAVMSIPAFKGVEVGIGFDAAKAFGSAVHDEILGDSAGAGVLARATNRSGGLEGGTTHGEDVVVRGAMKPISTLRKALRSVDLEDGQESPAGYERSDVCAVSAASVVAESMVALVVADAWLHRIGGETMAEVAHRSAAHRDAVARLIAPDQAGA